jgi:hypothetical protein
MKDAGPVPAFLLPAPEQCLPALFVAGTQEVSSGVFVAGTVLAPQG